MNGGYAFLTEIPGFTTVNNGCYYTPGPSTFATTSGNQTYQKQSQINQGTKVVVEEKIENASTFSEELGLILVGALVFIISFMWKDFITDFQHVFLSENPSILARFFYTLLVSIFIVQIIVWIRNYLKLSKRFAGFFPLEDVPDAKSSSSGLSSIGNDSNGLPHGVDVDISVSD